MDKKGKNGCKCTHIGIGLLVLGVLILLNANGWILNFSWANFIGLIVIIKAIVMMTMHSKVCCK